MNDSRHQKTRLAPDAYSFFLPIEQSTCHGTTATAVFTAHGRHSAAALHHGSLHRRRTRAPCRASPHVSQRRFRRRYDFRSKLRAQCVGRWPRRLLLLSLSRLPLPRKTLPKGKVRGDAVLQSHRLRRGRPTGVTALGGARLRSAFDHRDGTRREGRVPRFAPSSPKTRPGWWTGTSHHL